MERASHRIANEIRADLVALSNRARTPHLGSCLSCADLLTGVYWGPLAGLNNQNISEESRDQFIISKGHAAPALYVTLAKRGIIDPDLLKNYAETGAALAEQPAPFCVPGVEWATGSLGHGLGVAIGKALAARIKKRDPRFVVLMSDGECNEGSVWEAAMFAPAHDLENILVLVDFNKWQATGRSCEIMALESLSEKWKAFGWNVAEIDGHDPEAISGAIDASDHSNGKPTAIIAHTVKGKGVSFMEDDNNWHYRIPTDEEVEDARIQLLGSD